MKNNLLQDQNTENSQQQLNLSPKYFPPQFPPELQYVQPLNVQPLNVQPQYVQPNIGYQPNSNLLIINQESQLDIKNKEIFEVEFQISKTFCFYFASLWCVVMLHIGLIILLITLYYALGNSISDTEGGSIDYITDIFAVLISILSFFALGYSIGIVSYMSKTYCVHQVFRFYLFVMIIPTLCPIFIFGIYGIYEIYTLIEFTILGGFIYVSGKFGTLLFKRTRLLNEINN